MKLKLITAAASIALFIFISVQIKADTYPKTVVNGNIMEIYQSEGDLTSKGTIKTIDGKNIKEGSWILYYEKSKAAKKKAEGDFKDDKRNGIWTFYNENGLKKNETTYENGNPNGIQKNFNLKGEVESEIPYINGNISGFKKYYKSGVLVKEEQIVDNKKNGISREYYTTSGAVGKISNYKNDKLDGNQVTYYPDGKKKMEGNYRPVTDQDIQDNPAASNKEGLKTGPWTMYHKNGNIQMTGSFLNDKMNGKWQTFYPEGQLESEGMASEGSKNGVWKFYNINGVLEKEMTLVKDMVNGICKIYDNGKISGQGDMSGLPTKPRRNGDWTIFYPNGKVKSENVKGSGKYMMDKKNGKFREYYPGGNLMAEGDYMNDKKNGNWIFYKEDGRTADDSKTGYYMMDNLKKNLKVQ
jgi:antitoxin component YwqK of YwqJK toxin-antitoxin module